MTSWRKIVCIREDLKREGWKEDIKKMIGWVTGLNQNRVHFYFIDMLKAMHYCHRG